MSSLSEFSKKFQPKQNQEKTQQKPTQNNNNFEQDVKSNYDKFSGLNQSELFNELHKEGQRLKSTGQFDYNALKNAIDNMSGYISEEQKQKMLELLKQI